MKVVVLSPWKVLVAGALSCLLVMGGVLGGLALWDMLRPDAARAVEAAGVVGKKYWYFAEGYTGDGFEEWLCVENPGEEEANLSVTYYLEDGSHLQRSHTVEAGSRLSINVNTDVGRQASFAARIESDRPVVVERPVYFLYGGALAGGHCEAGFAEVY